MTTTNTNYVSEFDAMDINSVWLPMRFNDVEKIEELFCLATLVATKQLGSDATLTDSSDWYNKVGSCDNCQHKLVCLACIINE